LWLEFFSGMLRDAHGMLEHSLVMKAMAVKGPVWSGFADYFAGKACSGSQPYPLVSATNPSGNTLTILATADAET
jgi:hypothetical protein